MTGLPLSAMGYHCWTTLSEIRAQRPCEDGWRKLLDHLGKTGADDEPLHLMTVLESNGLDDALWCLRVPSLERLSRHFQAWCAEQVLHLFEAKYPDDMRVRDQIAMLRNDDATPEERAAALAAAMDAVRAALAAAWAAARAAARDSRDAAWDVARDAPEERAAAQEAVRAARETQLRAMIEGNMK